MRRLVRGLSTVTLSVGVLFGGFILTALPALAVWLLIEDVEALLGIVLIALVVGWVVAFIVSVIRR